MPNAAPEIALKPKPAALEFCAVHCVRKLIHYSRVDQFDFHVGNLYLNRKITGAMVGAHPFGGFNMSGTDSKTGGKDYLLLFLQAKSIAEKV